MTKEQLGVLDLLIDILADHEKALDEMIGNLTLAVSDLYKVLDRLRQNEEILGIRFSSRSRSKKVKVYPKGIKERLFRAINPESKEV